MVFSVHSTIKGYIRAEGDFIKKYTVERTNKAEIKPNEQSEEAETGRENLWNETAERTIKTETDTRTE